MLDKINEEGISVLVDNFYEKVRKDDILSDVFNTVIKDWDSHLIKLKNFWGSVLLGADSYFGNPFMKHMGLKTQSTNLDLDNKVTLENGSKINTPITKEHFKVWLELFEETCKEVFVESEAEKIIQKANMIAKSLQMGMFMDTMKV